MKISYSINLQIKTGKKWHLDLLTLNFVKIMNLLVFYFEYTYDKIFLRGTKNHLKSVRKQHAWQVT